MNLHEEDAWIVEAVRETYEQAERPWPSEPSGPVPLNALIGAFPLVHEEVPGLNHAAVSALLGRWGVRLGNLPQPDPALAGFLYANARRGYIFVRQGDGLPRRRFSAAHELGHYRLHLAPALDRGSDAEMVQSDEKIHESGEAELAAMERQANRFATELIMPEAVCRILFERCASRYGTTPRFLVHHLAGELLVSREAIAWRLYGLGLIEKPNWLARGHSSSDTSTIAEKD